MAKHTPPRAVARPLALYATGHVVLLGGAWAMGATSSMWPMALASSACLMLTAPLVRHLLQRAAAKG